VKRNWFERWLALPEVEKDGLMYWRERILYGFLVGGLSLCPIALIPSIVLIVKHRFWPLAAINATAIITLLYLLAYPRLSYYVRSLGVIGILYGISIGVLTNAGIMSGGPFWLFIIPILTSLLLGLRAAWLAVSLNACILIAVSFLISRGAIGTGPFFVTRESALATLGNFVLLNAGATLPVSIIAHGLKSVISAQNETADRLRHEIAERKRGQSALQESDLKYRQIFENIQDVYYEANLDGRILEISPSIEKISQYRRDELIGRSLHDIYADPEHLDIFMRIIVEKQRVEDHEIVLKGKDGSVHECLLVSSIVSDDEGRPVKIVGSLRDITACKHVEA
jgi:PAS domain S-box-containing protein